MFGIKSYKSQKYSSVEDILRCEGENLRKPLGLKITETFVVWDLKDDDWCNNAPVIFVVDNARLELCANKEEEFLD